VSHDTKDLCNLFGMLAWRPCAMRVENHTVSPHFCGFKARYTCHLKFKCGRCLCLFPTNSMFTTHAARKRPSTDSSERGPRPTSQRSLISLHSLRRPLRCCPSQSVRPQLTFGIIDTSRRHYQLSCFAQRLQQVLWRRNKDRHCITTER